MDTDTQTKFKPVARYRCAGKSFWDEERWLDLTCYDQYEAAFNAPREAYAFNIYEVPDQDTYGEARNISATYFLNGTVINLTDLTTNFGIPLTGKAEELVELMKLLNMKRVILTSIGGWQPMEDTDIVIHSFQVC